MTQTLYFAFIDSLRCVLKNRVMRSRMKQFTPRKGPSLFLLIPFFIFSGCALLFPDRTAPKSASYEVNAPQDPWHRLPVGESSSSVDAMKADVAYENTETGAIISLNSICRKYSEASLDSLTMNLVRGIGARKMLSQQHSIVNEADALDSTFEGIVDGVKVNINTIVLKKNSCTYDFIYVEVPKKSVNSRPDFQTFVSSFRAE